MDNITHSLIGVAVAQSILPRKFLQPRHGERTMGAAATLTAIVGNNLPDWDVLWAPLFSDPKLGNLLHHRGYTHTFLAAVPQGVMAAMVAVLFWRFFDRGGDASSKYSKRQWLILSVIGMASVCLHIAADFGNDYGVHPFSPFHNSWYFGDSIFIVEPLLWFSLLPLVVFSKTAMTTVARRFRYGFTIIFTIFALALVWLFPGMNKLVSVYCTVWLGLVFACQSLVRSKVPALLATFFVFVVFAGASQIVKQKTRAALPFEPIDLATSPSPGNPFCWRVMASWLDPTKGELVTEYGYRSLWPSQFDPNQCFARKAQDVTSERSYPSLHSTDSLVWEYEVRAERARLDRLKNEICNFREFLHFGRFPYAVTPLTNGYGAVFGDLRYDFEPGLGFAEFEQQAETPCQEYHAPWMTPVARALWGAEL